MTENKRYRCVNCGEAAVALYKTYGPSVVKLTKCKKCNGIVDKYIEYDPVIVMIDLVLMSREAQRHVIYNTEFKVYWKLSIVLIMVQTYGLWRSDSLFSIVVHTMCDIKTIGSTLNTTHLSLLFPLDVQMPESVMSQCWGWQPEGRGDETDLFIREKDFYILFFASFAGVAAFMFTVHTMMMLVKPFIAQNEACFTTMLKGISLANLSTLLDLPMLVWGGAHAAPARAAHYALVALYCLAAQLNTFTVLYECPMVITTLVLTASNCAKLLTTYYSMPFVQELLQ